MRTYERTHPWISFHLDLRRAPRQLWTMLGECQSKCEHIAGVPLWPETEKKLHRLFLARGALATTAIEGNTLSEEEVIKHLEGRLRLPPSRQYLAREIDNVVRACDTVLHDVIDSPDAKLTVAKLEEMNAELLKGLALPEGVVAGRLRSHEVSVGRYHGAPAEDCRYLLERLCDWLHSPQQAGSDEDPIISAALGAVFAHLYLAWIHPFGDGNGRTARLVELRILIAAGAPTPAAHLLSNHYNQTRAEYYRQLDAASRTGDPLPFILYAIEGFRDGLRAQLDTIRAQQLDMVWRNYVHEQFGEEVTASQARRRQLLLDISAKGGTVSLSALDQVSARAAAAYATRTRRTLTRDVNALRTMGLVEVTAGGIRAKKEVIAAFLPVQASARLKVETASNRAAVEQKSLFPEQ